MVAHKRYVQITNWSAYLRSMITKETKLYLVCCGYTVKHPMQVTGFNSCRMPENESESVLNYEVFRVGLLW